MNPIVQRKNSHPSPSRPAEKSRSRGRREGAGTPARGLRETNRDTVIAVMFDQHYSRLLRLAVLLGAGADAEDVVAEAFCQLHRRWSRLRTPEAAAGYLRSIVCNQTRMQLRHSKVVRRFAQGHVDEHVRSAEAQALLRDDQRSVVDALRLLPTRQREALVLRYWLDLKESEIASTMGISAGAVKSHTARGIAKLTRLLHRGTP